MTQEAHTVKTRIWDLPTRLFHIVLALCVLGLVITGDNGDFAMAVHFYLGYTVLTLVVFRVIWGLVGGQFHHEGLTLAAPEDLSQDEGNPQGRPYACGIEGEHDQPLKVQHAQDRAVRDHGPDHQGIDWNSRRAGHERSDQNGGQTVAAIVDHPGRHNARHGAGKTRQQGNKGPAMQAGPAHDPVHQKGRPGHIAGIFQQDDEEKQDQDLWQEDQDTAHPGNHPVDHQVTPPALGQDMTNQIAQAGKALIDQVHDRDRPDKHCLEHDEEQAKQDGKKGPK